MNTFINLKDFHKDISKIPNSELDGLIKKQLSALRALRSIMKPVMQPDVSYSIKKDTNQSINSNRRPRKLRAMKSMKNRV